jgi:hypothetical protein
MNVVDMDIEAREQSPMHCLIDQIGGIKFHPVQIIIHPSVYKEILNSIKTNNLIKRLKKKYEN